MINVRVYMTTKVLMSRTSNELATLASKWRKIKKQMTGIRKTKKKKKAISEKSFCITSPVMKKYAQQKHANKKRDT